MIEFLVLSVVVGSLAAFLLTLGYKWGIVEKMQTYAPTKVIEKLFDCQFCMTFWLCVVLSAVMSIVCADGWLLLIPFVATKIGLKLL